MLVRKAVSRILGRRGEAASSFCYSRFYPTKTLTNRSLACSPFLQIARFGDYKGSVLPTNDTSSGPKVDKNQKNMKKKSSRKAVTKVRDQVDLGHLFDPSKVSLARYKDEKQVDIKELVEKLVVLLFAPRMVTSTSFQNDCRLLMEVYVELKPKGFEVVFIPPDKLPAQEVFDAEFSWMPWAAIPYCDTKSRQHVQRNLGVSGSKEELSTVYVIDPTGLVLQRDLKIFQAYGALGYPFTDERLESLVKSEYEDIISHPSLKKILASRQRDYVITNKGEKVPICSLEDKVVALFFYEENYTNRSLTAELMKVYDELRQSKENFEVVLIYTSKGYNSGIRPSEREFWKRFQTMPWLALPFRDLNEKKLVDIFETRVRDYDWGIDPPELVIFGPRGEFIEPLGVPLLFQFGSVAYPFSRKKVAEIYTEKAKELRLEGLWNANTVFSGTDGSQVPLSHFAGKRLILFVERLALDWDAQMESIKVKFLKSLKEIYLQMKGTDDEFEVIHILEREGSLSTTESQAKSSLSVVKLVGDMPWLVTGNSELLPADFDFYFCGYDLDIKFYFSVLVAFDRDGTVVRSTIYPVVDDVNFPFYRGGLEDEALAQINTLNGWNYWDYYPNKGRIYSMKDKLLQVSF